MAKYVLVRKDKDGKELFETPCPMEKWEAEQMLLIMNSAGSGYIYEIKETSKASPS